MKRLAITILTLLLSTLLLNSQSLSDQAYRAYKAKDYIKALKLYTKAAQNGEIKAYYALGTFYERGIGVKKDPKKAKKLYLYMAKIAEELERTLHQHEAEWRAGKELFSPKKLTYFIAALQRLEELEPNETKKEEFKKRKEYLLEVRNAILKKKKVKMAQNLKKQEHKAINKLSQKEVKKFTKKTQDAIAEFLALCPAAKIVAPEDREGIEKFDCALFEHFPKRMALFMKLRRIRKIALKNPKLRDKILPIIDKKSQKLIKPIIKFLQEDTIKCYKRAKNSIDIQACDYDYLLRSDPLLFDNAAARMEQVLTNSKSDSKKLSKKDIKILIKRLKEKIKNGTFGYPWRK